MSVSTLGPQRDPESAARRLPAQLTYRFKTALASFSLAFAFCVSLWVAYRLLIPAMFGAFGSGLVDISLQATAVNWAFALAPSVLLPRKLTRPADILVLAQYYCIYAPACILLSHVSLPHLSAQDVLKLQSAMFGGMIILLVMRRLPLVRLRRPRLSPRAFVALFGGFSAALFAYLLIVLGRNFRLTDLQQIYDVRANAWRAANQAFAPGLIYALIWAGAVVIPVGFAIVGRRSRLLSASLLVVGYVFLLGIGGAKTSIAAIGVIPAVFVAARAGSARLATGMPLVMIGVFAVAFVMHLVAPPLIAAGFIAVAIERVFCVPTFLLAQYLNFFGNHPLTHFSHVAVINRVITYPYNSDLASTIGLYFYGVPVGSNAGMWAADGIASLGVHGIVVVSLIAGSIFWLIDSVAADLDIRLTTTALAFVALQITNVSLATTLLSGGVLLLIAWALVAPPEARGDISAFPQSGTA